MVTGSGTDTTWAAEGEKPPLPGSAAAASWKTLASHGDTIGFSADIAKRSAHSPLGTLSVVSACAVSGAVKTSHSAPATRPVRIFL